MGRKWLDFKNKTKTQPRRGGMQIIDELMKDVCPMETNQGHAKKQLAIYHEKTSGILQGRDEQPQVIRRHQEWSQVRFTLVAASQ